jgi:hypothetical protein
VVSTNPRRITRLPDSRAGTGQGMDDIEETLGHDLQIGCQRYRRTIDEDADHHSTPSALHIA